MWREERGTEEFVEKSSHVGHGGRIGGPKWAMTMTCGEEKGGIKNTTDYGHVEWRQNQSSYYKNLCGG